MVNTAFALDGDQICSNGLFFLLGKDRNLRDHWVQLAFSSWTTIITKILKQLSLYYLSWQLVGNLAI